MGGANWPPSSYDPESHLLYVCATDRINSFSVQAELPTPKSNDVYMGGRFVQANADDRGILAALDVRDEQARVAPAVARDLLQRFRRDGGRAAVRRPQRRPAHRARQEQRQVALGVPDRRRREHHRHHVRLERRSARRRARGRRRVRRRAARRRHLDVLSERHDEVVAGRRRADGRRRRRSRRDSARGPRRRPRTAP